MHEFDGDCVCGLCLTHYSDDGEQDGDSPSILLR